MVTDGFSLTTQQKEETIMNSKTLAALLVAAAGFAAAPSFAENLDNPAFPEAQGAPVSRAQVQAELDQYQQQLHSQPARAQEPPFAARGNGQPSVLTRDQVRAEALQARGQHRDQEPGHNAMPI